VTSPARTPGRRWLPAVATFLLLAGLLPASTAPVLADSTTQGLPFSQNWSNTGLITTNDDWSGVPGIIGYRGDAMAPIAGVDPQTILADGSATPVDVNANVTNPSTFQPGGVAEAEIADPTIALQGSGTARAPHIVISVATTGLSAITVAYNLRDIDGSSDNTRMQLALQFRVGNSGDYTNVPAGYVSDASTGGSATQVTPVNATLPAAADNQPLVQVRVLMTDAPSTDEMIGVDDISITGTGDAAPFVASTNPAAGATGVPINATPTITFSEDVTLAPGAVSLVCTAQGAKTVTPSGGPSTYSLGTDPFQNDDHCTIGVTASAVSDADAIDPPDTMVEDFASSFDTAAATPTIKVSEVYGGGGNAGAALKNDFIELYNPTGSAASLTGWSVQYASAAGSTWQVTALTGPIPAGRNYLVQEAAGAGGTVDLPTPDATGSIPMSATAGKVALVSSTTALTGTCPTGGAIVDFVGYGTTANCFEGSGPTAAPSNTTSVQRIGGGATDTNNNAADFVVGLPDPHASGDQAPFVASSTPANGAVGVARATNITVTFSEAVTVTGAWFAISCATSGAHTAVASGGPTAFTLDPDVDFAANESCTVTIVAADVADQDAEDPPDNMARDATITFTTIDAAVCGDPGITLVHDIQGAGLASPITGSVVSIEGVVVGDYQQAGGFGGFYVQEEDADADANPATSEGLFVFSTLTDVTVGDDVRVKGTVTEFNSSGTTLTELGSVQGVLVCSTGNAAPAAAHVSLPVANLTDWESVEGMRVDLSQTLTVTEVFNLGRFGEVSLSGAGRLPNPTNVVSPGAPSIALADLNDRSRFILDDGDNRQNIDPTQYPQGGLSASNTLRVGDTLSSLTGIGDQRFGSYRIQPVGPISFDHTNPRPAAPEAVGGNLRVASFNVLNFFNGNGTHLDGAAGGFPTERGAETLVEFDRQLAKEVSAITALNADIVGLMELENDDPAVGQAAIEDLVDGLNAATAPGTYAFIDTGIVGTDAIKVGLLYKPAVVTPVGAFAKIDSTVDPRFIDTKNRPSIAQTFELNATGARLTVLVNHLKSKGSDCNDVGDPDTGDGQGNCNITRTQAAEAIVDWLATDPTGAGDADYLLIGDMNSYAMEDPITAFKAGGFVDTINAHVGSGAYSYVFDGESGYLDHALASASLAGQVSDVTEWHINPDEPTALDYNTNFKSPGQIASLYDPGPYRSSDHDPVLVGLDLKAPNAAPTVDAGGPYEVIEGDSVTVSASGSDPDGDALTYEWDLDNDGTFETSGQSATFSAAALDAPQTLTIRVRVSDGLLSATDTATVNVIWRFTGFFQPVANRPTLNVAKAGSAIPIKFALGGDQGLDIVAEGYPASIQFACDETALTEAIETTESPGAAGLSFDAGSGTYHYTWKTQKSWAGTCRRFVLKLADGTFHYADFQFKR
jgi:predicted extracellular nuclease